MNKKNSINLARAIAFKSLLIGIFSTIVSFYAVILIAGPPVLLFTSLNAILLGSIASHYNYKLKDRQGLIIATLGTGLGIFPFFIALLPGLDWISPLFTLF